MILKKYKSLKILSIGVLVLFLCPIICYGQNAAFPKTTVAVEDELSTEEQQIEQQGPEIGYDSPERIARITNPVQWYHCPHEVLEFTVPPRWDMRTLNNKIEWLEKLVDNPELLSTKEYKDSCLLVPLNTGIGHTPLEVLSISVSNGEKRKIFKNGVDITIEEAVQVYKTQRERMHAEGFANTNDFIIAHYDSNLYRAKPEVIEWMLDCPMLGPEERIYWEALRSGDTLTIMSTLETMAWTGFRAYWDGTDTDDWHTNSNWTRYDGVDEYYVVPVTSDIVDILNLYTGGSSIFYCKISNGNTPYLYRLYIYDFDGSRTLELTNSRNVYIGQAGDPNYEEEMYIAGGSIYKQSSGNLYMSNSNTTTGVGMYGTADIGCCLVVDGTLQMYGGNMYIDDDLIVHGDVSHTAGTIQTGYNSTDGALYISGSAGLTPTYTHTGGTIQIHRKMYTSGGYGAYGTGTGYYRGSGTAKVEMDWNDNNDGWIYIYDGSDGHSYFYDLEIDGNTALTCGSGRELDINNDFTINSSDAFTANSYNMLVAGDWTNNGTFTPGTNTVTFDGSINSQILGGITTFYNLTLNTTSTAFNALENGTGDGAGIRVNVTNDLTITDGSFELNDASGTELDVNGDIAIQANGTINANDANINIYCDNNWTNSGSFDAGSNSTVTFDNSSTIITGGTGAAQDFYHVVSSANATLSTNDIDINGNFTISAGTWNASGHDMYVAGNWTGTGSFTHGSNTVIFNGSANSTITPAETFYGLKTQKTAVTDTVKPIGGNIICSNFQVLTGVYHTNTRTLTVNSIGGEHFIVDGANSKLYVNANVTITDDGFGNSDHLYIKNNGIVELTSGTLRCEDNIYIGNGGTGGTFKASGGTVDFWDNTWGTAGGSTMIIYNGGLLQITGTVICEGWYIEAGSGGTADIEPNATLKLKDATGLNTASGGTIEVLGTAGNLATITMENTGGHQLYVVSGSTIKAQYAKFEYMDAYGVECMSGSQIGSTSGNDVDDFDNCTFDNATRGLTISNSETFTIDAPVFNSGLTYNIDKTNDAGDILVCGATGAKSGEDYDDDSYGRVTWSDTPVTPYNPDPAHNETDVGVEDNLSWSGDGTSYDVYFNDFSPPTTCVETDNTTGTYEPGTMDYLEDYYWKIVSKSPCGNTEGPVWHFQTQTEPASSGTWTSPVIKNPSSGACGGGWSKVHWTQTLNGGTIYLDINDGLTHVLIPGYENIAWSSDSCDISGILTSEHEYIELEFKLSDASTGGWVELNDVCATWNSGLTPNADECVWVGCVDTDWDDEDNWCKGTGTTAPPSADDNVIIGSDAIDDAVITTSPGLCNDITISSASHSLILNNGLTVNGDWDNTSGNFTPGSNTVTFGGGAATITPGGLTTGYTFNNVICNATGTKTLGGDIKIGGNFTLTAGTWDVDAADYSMDVGGNWTKNGGTFTYQEGDVVFTGTSNSDVAGSQTTTFYDLTVDKSVGTEKVTFATRPMDVNNDLSINKGELEITYNSAWSDVDGNLTIGTNGILDQQMNWSSSYGIYVGGNWNDGGSFLPYNPSAIQLDGNDPSTISAVNAFHYLLMSGGTGHVITMNTNVTVNSDCWVGYSGSGAIPVTFEPGGHKLTVGATLVNSGTINVDATTDSIVVAYNLQNGRLANGIINVSAGIVECGTTSPYDFYNGYSTGFTGELNITNTGAVTSNDAFHNGYAANGTINISGGTLTVDGIFYNGYTGPFTGDIDHQGGAINANSLMYVRYGSTFDASGTADINVANSLYIGSATTAGTMNLYGSSVDLDVDNDLTIYGSSALDCNDGTPYAPLIYVDGNWSNSGTFTSGQSNVELDGTGAQDIGGSVTSTFYNLIITNTSTTITLGHDIAVSNTLYVDEATCAGIDTDSGNQIDMDP